MPHLEIVGFWGTLFFGIIHVSSDILWQVDRPFCSILSQETYLACNAALNWLGYGTNSGLVAH